jgi:hypothetical protein
VSQEIQNSLPLLLSLVSLSPTHLSQHLTTLWMTHTSTQTSSSLACKTKSLTSFYSSANKLRYLAPSIPLFLSHVIINNNNTSTSYHSNIPYHMNLVVFFTCTPQHSEIPHIRNPTLIHSNFPFPRAHMTQNNNTTLLTIFHTQ